MTDLQPFCIAEKDYRDLHKPLSHGEWTYATNSHIAVRVPRRSDVSDGHKVGPKLEALFKVDSANNWRALRPVHIPAPMNSGECGECHGSGREHDCPNCTCKCEGCNGTGKDETQQQSATIGGVLFSAQYVRLLQSLPNCEVPTEIKADHQTPMPFRFDGGQGVLMGLRHPYADHQEIDA